MGEYMEDGYFTGQHVGMLRTAIENLLNEIRPDAVPLVDTFNFPDYLLNSCLGRYDGNGKLCPLSLTRTGTEWFPRTHAVYEHMYEWARNNPMNASHLAPGFKKHIQPLIHGKATARL